MFFPPVSIFCQDVIRRVPGLPPASKAMVTGKAEAGWVSAAVVSVKGLRHGIRPEKE